MAASCGCTLGCALYVVLVSCPEHMSIALFESFATVLSTHKRIFACRNECETGGSSIIGCR